MNNQVFYSVVILLYSLAHNAKFDDNKLMINKFKDFLKNKLSRKQSSSESEQDEILVESSSSSSDSTGDIPVQEMDVEKISLADRFKSFSFKFKNKIPALRPKSFELPKSLKGKSDAGPLLSPNISKHVENFLNRKSREPIHQVFLVVLVCSVTYTFGKMSALVMRGSPVFNSPQDFSVSISLENDFNTATLNQVKGINIFRTNTGLGKKKNLADTKCEEGKQNSSLPIKFVNSIVLQDSIKSIASVQVRGGRELQEVRIGDQIDNMAKIFKISRSEIVIKNLENGSCESIASSNARETRSTIAVMSPAATKAYFANKKISGIDNVGNKFTISKALLDEKLKDIASILTQAKAVKIQNPDGSLAFKMTELDPEGLFPYLGIQDQDIITSINGKPIYDINEVMSLFGRIKNLDQLQLGIKREGTDSNQEYAIKK